MFDLSFFLDTTRLSIMPCLVSDCVVRIQVPFLLSTRTRYLIQKISSFSFHTTDKNDGTAVRELYRTQARLRLDTIDQRVVKDAELQKQRVDGCLKEEFY